MQQQEQHHENDELKHHQQQYQQQSQKQQPQQPQHQQKSSISLHSTTSNNSITNHNNNSISQRSNIISNKPMNIQSNNTTNGRNTHHHHPQQLQQHQQQQQQQHRRKQHRYYPSPPSTTIMNGTKANVMTATLNSSLLPAKLILYNGLRLFIFIQLILSLVVTLHYIISTDNNNNIHGNDQFINDPFPFRRIQQQNTNKKNLVSPYIGRNTNNNNPRKSSSSSSALYNALTNNMNNNQDPSKPKIILTSFCIPEEEQEQDEQQNLFTLDNYCSRPHYDYNITSIATTATDNTKKESISTNEESNINKKNNNKKTVYKHNTIPILIIGGTDGSGTRAFVDLLQNELGVSMIIEDKQTLDIHASILFQKQGWPALANYIFNYTHSGNYNINNDLPPSVKNIIMNELQRFKRFYDQKAKSTLMYPNNGMMGGGGRRIPGGGGSTFFGGGINCPSLRTTKHSFERSIHASPYNSAIGVLYGFKAPISMMILPFLLELYGNVKFIHVIRDGRDVSLSSNMSPVNKFYNTFYGNNTANERRNYAMNITQTIQKAHGGVINPDPKFDPTSSILAMDLWNDWNIQVNQFCQQAVQDTKKNMMNNEKSTTGSSSTSKSFDYIIVRTEDLVSSSYTTKYALITKLASFVGAIQYPNTNLCTYIKGVKVQDMGQSAKFYDHMDPRNKGVRGRYPGHGGRLPSPQFDREMMHLDRLGGDGPRKSYNIHRHRRLSSSSFITSNDTNHNNNYTRNRMNIKNDNDFEEKRSQLIETLLGNKNKVKRRSRPKDNDDDPAAAAEGLSSNYRMEDYIDNNNNYNDQKEKEKEEVTTTSTTNKRRLLLSKYTNNHNIINKNINNQNVLNRYGKWMNILQNETILSNILHERGSIALQYFGYEPYQDNIDYDIYHSFASSICPSDE